MMRLPSWWLGALVLVCAPAVAAVQSAETPPPPAAESPDAPWLEWTSSLLVALEEQDAAAFDALVDADAILDRAAQGIADKNGFVSGFKQGARTTMTGGQGLFANLIAALEADGHVDFLRLRGKPDARTALFRIVSTDTGINYLEFELSKTGTAPARAIDFYSAASGEQQSTTLRRWLLPLAADKDKGFLERLVGTEAALVKHWTKVERVTKAAQSGDVELFAKRVAALPEELRRDKLILLMRIRVFPFEDARYLEAIGELRKHYADDPCTRLHSIDWYIARGEIDTVVKEVRHMSEWAGGDPYLPFLLSGILVEAKRYDAARTSAREAITVGLGWIEPYWILVTVSLRQERFEETLAVLREIDEAFTVEWADFATVDEYKGFVESPQHAEWLAYLKSKSERGVSDEPR